MINRSETVCLRCGGKGELIGGFKGQWISYHADPRVCLAEIAARRLREELRRVEEDNDDGED